MRFPNMVESADEPEVSSHGIQDLLADLNTHHSSHLPHIQIPTWSFPLSTPARDPLSPGIAEGSIFSPRQPPRHQPNSAPELDLAASSPDTVPAPSTNQPSLFNTPNRSIFSSGPPTSSISSNQAQASMSSPSPVHTPHPLSALPISNPSRSRKAVHYQSENQS